MEVDQSLHGADFNQYDWTFLAELAVLTRSFCRELQESSEASYGRANAALELLERWTKDNCGYSRLVYEPSEIDAAPANVRKLVEEIQDGLRVCDSYRVVGTADYAEEDQRDRANFKEKFAVYWSKHPNAVQRP